MKKLTIILILNAFNICVRAQSKLDESLPRFTAGVEWGYSATIFSGFHYNFFSPDGYRVDESDNDIGLSHNGEMYIHAGYNISRFWNLSLYLGYRGIGNLHNAIPISVRGTKYFGNDPLKDRWFIFGDIGSGICIKRPVQEIATGKIGGGYRISLSRDTKMDFHISAVMTYTHPEILYDGISIPIGRTNRNSAYLGGISLNMAIVF